MLTYKYRKIQKIKIKFIVVNSKKKKTIEKYFCEINNKWLRIYKKKLNEGRFKYGRNNCY